MKLHVYKDEFNDLISIVSRKLHIPESAVERDYYIVLLLKKLENSEYSDKCVFKGGTSLSKCYPSSIERFSEDIDLTFLGMDLSDNVCDKTIKKIEKIMTEGAETKKIPSERNSRSKSIYFWFENENSKVKIEIGSSVRPDPYSKKTFKSYIHEYLEEIGSSVRPDPYSKKTFKSYIHEYLEEIGKNEEIKKYEFSPVTLNVLNIERTFIDKVMSVKRHAICGSLNNKVRHIYDVVRLYDMKIIQNLVHNKSELKRLIQLTKDTDYYYLAKRDILKEYNPKEPYDFDSWKFKFSSEICMRY